MFGLHVSMYSTGIPGSLRGQKRGPNTLEVELQMVVSHRVILGAEPRFFAKVTCAFNR